MFSSNSSQVSSSANYIENVFSTYLYTGTGATQTITNNIDTTTYGGLTWIKGRSGVTGHRLTDTARGVTKSLASETTVAQATESTGLTAFGTTGFTIGADADYNTSAATYVSWTFRKQAKFFDIVTYTGTGSARTVAHNLGAIPGMIIVKDTGRSTNWRIYNRGLNAGVNPEQYGIAFNTTDQVASTGFWNDTAPTSTVFTVNTDSSVNTSGENYVAYLFAHNAGGFGLTGADNVITCGSYTGNGSTLDISLGYEPQFVMIKCASEAGFNWQIFDSMRGMPVNVNGKNQLRPNLSSAETTAASTSGIQPTATGFQAIYDSGSNNYNYNGRTYIYIAIRRGPMAVPTLGTSVFTPVARSGSGTQTTTSVGFPVDLVIDADRSKTSVTNTIVTDRLRGSGIMSYSNATDAEVNVSASNFWNFDSNTGLRVGPTSNPYFNDTGVNYINWNFQRAPSFFDEVCYTGTGTAAQAQAHNLGVSPELILIKKRSGVDSWFVGNNFGSSTYTRLLLNSTGGGTSITYNSGATDLGGQPTSTNFYLGTDTRTNGSAATYVAYLFATCTGVSKVGSYTGTGATQTIACGFGASGARFVLIKRTDTTGDWYVWDSARGMISGTDPSLLLNSTAAEVNANSIYAISTGFQIVSTAAGINASAGTYIFLAIA